MMYKQKLKNAPLQEVIFELFWSLPLDDAGFPHDPDFELALGSFYSKIKEEFPVHKKLPAMPPNMQAYPRVEHQFWKDELTWPLIQLGQGILAVNDTEKNYVWLENFLPNMELAVRHLRESYRETPRFERAKLRYVDAVEYKPEKESGMEFVARNLNTVLKNNYSMTNRKQQDFHIAQTFELEDKSLLQLNIQNGTFNLTDKPAIVWTTSVEKRGNFDVETLFQWLDKAHQVTSETFVNMLNPEFYVRLDN